ncbi:MAG TPA: S-methyl-5-thioribose-1-phosphate isomerase [Gemmatimonadales bacterium]|nr:S-methyl-5-thioribose-1-phosphate isomerase [Gemmatimonadales bacterium]
MIPSPIRWTPNYAIAILDQTLLPTEERYLVLERVPEVMEALRSLRVRGAPLIGIAAAMGATLPARTGRASDVLDACDRLQEARPTAVNLRWALERMRAVAEKGGSELHQRLVAEANDIWDEDRAMCDRIGDAGLPLVPDGAVIHTHCNAGALATGGIGTALAPIYRAAGAGRRVSVIADETRPLLQGGRLTAWELGRAGIPVTVIADGMAASRMRQGDVTAVIVGADRIARNGDVANKIGTYGLALAARAHGVPFYVAAPRSTYDPETPDGAAIPIEIRREDELRRAGTRIITPGEASIWNPAFDVTPAALVTGYITDAGLISSPPASPRATPPGEW